MEEGAVRTFIYVIGLLAVIAIVLYVVNGTV